MPMGQPRTRCANPASGLLMQPVQPRLSFCRPLDGIQRHATRWQVGKTKRNPDGFRTVWLSVYFTNPHPSIMKHFKFGAIALLFSIGLSSCTLSYQYCDAYNGVDFENSRPQAVECPTVE